jgi:hypothetical protein
MAASIWSPNSFLTPPIFIERAVTAFPSPEGNFDSILTAFSGNIAGIALAISHSITGATTLTQPTAGYKYVQGAYPEVGYLYNTSGYNHSLTGNGGRTAAVYKYIKVDQYGQGDAVGVHVNSNVFVNKPGAINFLAQPAAICFNGQNEAFANFTYLNTYETQAQDNGFDVACIGIVHNFNRTNATGAQSCVWIGYRVQSTGSQPINSIISAVGKAKNGLDFSMSGLDFGATQSAISLKAGQRIYFNNNALASGTTDADFTTTQWNGDYITYSGGALNFVLGGSTRIQFSTTQAFVDNVPLLVRSNSAPTTGTIPDRFGPGTIRSITRGNFNSIIGIAQNNLAPATFGFPTAVTGLGVIEVGSEGNAAFGGYFEAHTYANTGTPCAAEIDTFNFGAAATINYPPDRSIGTLQQSPVALTVGAGGTARSHTAIQIVQEGSAPQSFLYGLGINPGAVTEYGIIIDATSGVGPNLPLLVKHKTAAIGVQIQAVGSATPANAVFQIVNTSEAVVFSIRQDGKIRYATANLQTTIGAAGGASALPATPLGYLRVVLESGTEVAVPYYTRA